MKGGRKFVRSWPQEHSVTFYAGCGVTGGPAARGKQTLRRGGRVRQFSAEGILAAGVLGVFVKSDDFSIKRHGHFVSLEKPEDSFMLQ